MANLKQLRRAGREKFLASFGLPSKTKVERAFAEQLYYQAFLDLKASIGVQRPFFPFGGAANASLLYLIARCLSELPISRACELGAGQSTLLFDSFASLRNIEVDSLEQRESWAKEVVSKLEHPERVHVHLCPLRSQIVRGLATDAYDLCGKVEGKRFDLILVDGPSGTRQRSRWGSLEVLDQCLADEFVVIFDDAERPGEMETIAEALRLLESKQIAFHANTVEAAKSQFVIATNGMHAAYYF